MLVVAVVVCFLDFSHLYFVELSSYRPEELSRLLSALSFRYLRCEISNFIQAELVFVKVQMN